MIITVFTVIKHSERVITVFNYDTLKYDGSAQYRFARWNAAIELFKSSPIIGVGLDQYQNLAQKCVNIIKEKLNID